MNTMPTSNPADATAVIAWLDAHDEPCPVCGYDLRGLTEPLCPECGKPLTLSVTARDLHRISSWLIATGAITLGLGFDAASVIVVLSRAVVNAARTGTPPAPLEIRKLVILSILALISTIGIGVMLRLRRRWVLLPDSSKRLYALALIAVVGLVHLVGAFTIPIII